MTDFDIRKAGGRIGAEVVGLDVREISGPVFAELNAALLEHKALVFLGRHLDDAGQLEFAARFGPLTGAHPTVPSVEGQPQILQVNGDEGIRSNHWHTDVTFVHTPPKVSTLRGIVLPPYGGNTLIANSAAAYRDLLQHYAPDDYGDLPRHLRRVTVAGDVPVGVDGKKSRIIEGDEAAHYTPAA